MLNWRRSPVPALVNPVLYSEHLRGVKKASVVCSLLVNAKWK